jgi:hypothetical protein
MRKLVNQYVKRTLDYSEKNGRTIGDSATVQAECAAIVGDIKRTEQEAFRKKIVKTISNQIWNNL